jgi:hypothetical protein
MNPIILSVVPQGPLAQRDVTIQHGQSTDIFETLSSVGTNRQGTTYFSCVEEIGGLYTSPRAKDTH